jgi:hypothetical protein
LGVDAALVDMPYHAIRIARNSESNRNVFEDNGPRAEVVRLPEVQFKYIARSVTSATTSLPSVLPKL